MDKLKEEKIFKLSSPSSYSSTTKFRLSNNDSSESGIPKMEINWKENACIVMYAIVIIRYCDFIFFNPS